MKLIIGLGNPGKDYQLTRHNVGFLYLDKLREQFGLPDFNFDKHYNAEISKGTINKKRVVLAKPQTFMNESGVAARALLDFFKLKPADLVVVHDDKDIALGTFKVQTNRGAGGHNGIKSLFEHLGTQDFLRLRVGVAPVGKEIVDTADFVLGRLTKTDQQALMPVFDSLTKQIEQTVGL